MPDAKPMSPERLAEIEALCEVTAGIRRDGASSHFGDPRYSCVIGSDRVEAMTEAIPEMFAEVRRLQSAVDLAARHTPFSSEPCPLCLHAGETCAMHRHIDSLGESLLARLGERDIARSRLDISESHGRDKDARIAALERDLESLRGWCRYALENWAPSCSDKADKMRTEVHNLKETK